MTEGDDRSAAVDHQVATHPAAHERPRPRVRDRDVYAVAAGVVLLVLVANVVSAAVPPLDRALAFAPVIVVVLLAVTVVVLFRSIRRGSRPD